MKYFAVQWNPMSFELCPDCGEPRTFGDWPLCADSTNKHGHQRPHGGTLLAAIHPSERTVIYRNPKTGERRVPARNDQPMPEAYARQGYVREELSTPAAIRAHEKETGAIHEASHYHKNSATAERDLALPDITPPKDPAITRRLVEALR